MMIFYNCKNRYWVSEYLKSISAVCREGKYWNGKRQESIGPRNENEITCRYRVVGRVTILFREEGLIVIKYFVRT